MAKIENKTCAVTVTYGNRWSFLSQIITRLLSLDIISHIVIVNNGSLYDIQDKLNEVPDDRLILIHHKDNKGSAGGYNAGIAYAHQNLETNFIWLLDDDNLPEHYALDVLMNTWDELGALAGETALFSLRTDRELDISFAKGTDPFKTFMVPNSFLGFSFLQIGRNKISKIINIFNRHTHQLKQLKKLVKMPYTPYGGFFFHRAMVDKIGYPNERFYLYNDDEEFTYRVTQSGGTIWLVTASQIKDIDTTDARVEYKAKPFSSKILDLWNFRMYYRIRNTVYFHKKQP